jgi:hypothetical protein
VSALLPTRQDTHPLGCHRSRIPDRIVFDKLIQVLVFGCGYRRLADHTCSATTLRRRRDEWIALGLTEQLRWCTERRRVVVEFWLALANAVLVCGRLVRRAWACYRWDSRPRRRP